MAGTRARLRQVWMGLRAGLGLSFAFTSEETDEKRANQLTFAPGDLAGIRSLPAPAPDSF
ncbi:hypothetical protein BDQ94DRAFT_141976 [Aspergillus welwitschiae]|uniref:Uncharacterized protein n=1 Tax=Aspergillus welwitschiae TaxID=1341132 RepID=A0A3F3Q4C5_9EURO|nr:hypothetical protein BDQ94DRAFT_141976 [Aspergillus welwitschiae]RDH34059.1 hypothetical protein BDQ94DRAFT_141976 [Aspergillus welwitschiae]